MNRHMSHADPFDLDRFVMAQAPVYDLALAELIGGKKLSHWMWIDTLDEARAYLAHPVLGTRLRESVNAVLDCGETSLHEIFGSPDDLKFCSSMTLYVVAGQGDGEIFEMALSKFCGGRKDEQTLALLNISA